MSSAEGSQVGVNIKEETVWGTQVAGQMAGANFTEEDMSFNIENKASNTVRPDRQTADVVQVGADTAGGFMSELQFSNLDTLFPGFFWNAWVETDIVAGATASNLDIVFTIESGAGVGGTIEFGSSVDISHLKVGDFFWVTDAVQAGNNGRQHIKELVSAQVIRVDAPLVTETTEATTRVAGSNLVNGVLRKSYSIERAHNDISQFFLYTGMVGNELTVKLETGEFVNVEMSFVGKEEQLAQTQWGSTDPVSPPDADSYPIMNSVSDIGAVIMDGTAVSGCLLKDIEFTLNNKTEGKTGVGVLGYCDASGKSIELTGNITLYFIDQTYYNKYKNSTSFSIILDFTDSVGNAYAFELKRIKFDEATTNVTGKDDDVLLETSFIGTVSSDGYTIGLARTVAP